MGQWIRDQKMRWECEVGVAYAGSRRVGTVSETEKDQFKQAGGQ